MIFCYNYLKLEATSRNEQYERRLDNIEKIDDITTSSHTYMKQLIRVIIIFFY